MKIGVCVGTDIERARLAREAGFDFVETNCGGLVGASDELVEEFKNLGIPVLTANCFIGMRIVGKEKDPAAIKEYLEKLFARSSYLGLEILVFGSSGARKMTEGMDLEETRTEIVEFLSEFVAPLAEKYNIRVAIEPLRSKECNVINTVPQGIEIAKRVNSPYVRVLADVKHMVSSDDPLEKLPEYKGWMIHAHTSNPFPENDDGRIFPAPGDGFDQDKFIIPAREAGIELVSVEAGCSDFEKDVRNAFEVLKKYR